MPNAPVPAAAPGLPSSRRSFLRGLTRLPLIGGGITLIGAPSAVAVPLSRDLLSNYETWLLCEAHQIARELHPEAPGGFTTLYNSAWEWHDAHADVSPPSTRAALVLSAVGCGWEGAR